MATLKQGNLALRFFLELAALAALAAWGFAAGGGAVWSWVLGLGAPLAMAVLWGTFLSPRATVVLPPPARLTLEAIVFLLALLALLAAGHPILAAIFATVLVANEILLTVWDQRSGPAPGP
ncbi:MAG TPA: YrdB family protein [Chloroflexia bacterium]|nr:YrdB family protein [Chloroflexia bacterium]